METETGDSFDSREPDEPLRAETPRATCSEYRQLPSYVYAPRLMYLFRSETTRGSRWAALRRFVPREWNQSWGMISELFNMVRSMWHLSLRKSLFWEEGEKLQNWKRYVCFFGPPFLLQDTWENGRVGDRAMQLIWIYSAIWIPKSPDYVSFWYWHGAFTAAGGCLHKPKSRKLEPGRDDLGEKKLLSERRTWDKWTNKTRARLNLSWIQFGSGYLGSSSSSSSWPYYIM